MSGRFAYIAWATLSLFWLSASVLAQSTTSLPDPEGAGFSAKRLARIAPWYQAQVDAGALPGAVVATARNGQLAYLDAIGSYDRAGKLPLKPDAIFWIASMTKPLTSVAAMILVEEGKLDLAAPVADYLPVFKDKPVGVEDIDPATGKHTLLLEPEKRPMQVIDLLRHTSGLIYPEEGKTALYLMYGLADFRRNRTLADFVASLATLPLVHQPGEVWEYSWGVDVLARVIEVASGQPFDQFLDSRIFKPLRMVDTGFDIPEEKRARLVDPIPGGWPALWDVTKPAKLFSGGGGLVSTAPDYLRFCQMLLNGGELDGVRILAAKTVQQMTTNACRRTSALPGSSASSSAQGSAPGGGWVLPFAPTPTSASCRAPSAVSTGAAFGARISGSIRPRS